jgi:hypothetical protein
VLLGGFAAAVAWRLCDGSIDLSDLLHGDMRDSEAAEGFSPYESPGRAQALAFTLFAAAYYLLRVFQHPKEFPELPPALLGALGGSHALYLGGKAQAMSLGRLRDIFTREKR